MSKYFSLLKKSSILLTMVMTTFVLVAVLLLLAYDVYDLFFGGNFIIESKAEVLELLGLFLLVVVILEIMETMWLYATKDEIHVEAVVLIAITAISRELIVFNYDHLPGALLAGAGVLIASLATAYYLILRAHREAPAHEGERVR
jgi:uncharacterized membrane protein (DUF373 family)